METPSTVSLSTREVDSNVGTNGTPGGAKPDPGSPRRSRFFGVSITLCFKTAAIQSSILFPLPGYIETGSNVVEHEIEQVEGESYGYEIDHNGGSAPGMLAVRTQLKAGYGRTALLQPASVMHSSQSSRPVAVHFDGQCSLLLWDGTPAAMKIPRHWSRGYDGRLPSVRPEFESRMAHTFFVSYWVL